MKNSQINIDNLKNAKILTREQLKKILGGDGPNDVLCYCSSPILPSGQYQFQWISDGCVAGLAAVASTCNGSANGDCGACAPPSNG